MNRAATVVSLAVAALLTAALAALWLAPGPQARWRQWQAPPPQAPQAERPKTLSTKSIGVLGEIDVVLSGYQGSDGIGDVILDAVARVK